MKRSIKLILILIFALLLTPTVFAEDNKCGENVYFERINSDTLKIYGTGSMYNYEKSANVPWVSYRESIKYVVIEDGVTSIGDYAFYWFRNLKNISVPDSIEYVGHESFYLCDKAFARFDIPLNLKFMSSKAFGNCHKLTTLCIKDIVKWLEVDTTICKSKICDKDGNIITDLVIPEGVEHIRNHAFYNLKLNSITLPSTIKSIGSFAFSSSKITHAYYNGTEAEWKKVSINDNNIGLVDNAKFHFYTAPEFDVELLRAESYKLNTSNQSIEVTAYDTEKSAGFIIKADGVNYRNITTDSGNGISATVVDGNRCFVAKKSNGEIQTFNFYISSENRYKFKFVATINFTFERELKVKDVATLRCHNAVVSEENKTITVKVDRFDESVSSGTIGVGIIASDKVKVTYEYVDDNGGELSTKTFSSTSTDKYTLMSDGINCENGGGSKGKLNLKIFKKSNGTRINTKVILSDGQKSSEYIMQIVTSDLATEGDADILNIKPLRADANSFVVDNDAKTIYYETLPGVTSAGFAVSVDNQFTKTNRPRRILTAKSGYNLSHGDIKTEEKDVFDRYVVARRSKGTTQTYQVKVFGGEDGLTYSWYTVTVVFK